MLGNVGYQLSCLCRSMLVCILMLRSICLVNSSPELESGKSLSYLATFTETRPLLVVIYAVQLGVLQSTPS